MEKGSSGVLVSDGVYVLLAKRKAHQSSLETSLDFKHDAYTREIENT